MSRYAWKLGAFATKRMNAPHSDEYGQIYGPIGLHSELGSWRLTDIKSGRLIVAFKYEDLPTSYLQEQKAKACAEFIADDIESLALRRKALSMKLRAFKLQQEEEGK